MSTTVKPIPEGFHTLTPYLLVADAAGEIDFLERAFKAEATHISRQPDGTIMHASLKIGTSMLMMGQVRDPWKPTAAMIYMYVDNVDEVYRRAIEAGGKSISEPKDQFYGDRSGGVADANGIQWWIGTHIEDVSDEELRRRAAANMDPH